MHLFLLQNLAYQQEEQQKREKKIVSLYDQWKVEASSARERLKSDGLTMSKLLVPEPPIFTVDPIHFIEFKQSFMALIRKVFC